MLAITTNFLAATITKGSRVRAILGDVSVIVPWDYGLDERENHTRAAMKVAAKYREENKEYATQHTWLGGEIDGGGFMFIAFDTARSRFVA